MNQPSPADDDPTVDAEVTRRDGTVTDQPAGSPRGEDPDRTTGAAEPTVDHEDFVTGAGEDPGSPSPRVVSTDPAADLPVAPADEDRTRRNETLDVTITPAADGHTARARHSLTAIRDADRPSRDRRPLPERISRYETVSLLGEGAFGIVLKSRDPKLDRLVAVKLQKVNAVQSRSSVDRFLREARSAAQLRHPCIVPVFEYGEFAENQFIVYQFIEGETLAEWNRQAQPSLRDKVEVIAKIADALDYAHSCGIVHRDIKPANILVDRHDRPHIADFGCARIETADVSATVDGSLMGTPAYMSPEVVAGNARQADGRADIWAVGVMLFELLSGERPFQGKITELFRQIPGMPAKPLRQIDRTIPADLQTICQKCLEKLPGQRFQTGAELAGDLRRWLGGMPITARRTSWTRRTWLWARRKPALAALLAVLASTLILITVTSVLFSVHLQNKQNEIVASQMASLASAAPAALPVIIDNLLRLDPSVSGQLQDALRAGTDATAGERARYQLAAWALEKSAGPPDPDLIRSLAEYLPLASEQELPVMVELAGDGLRGQAESLWQTARLAHNSNPQRLRAYCALAAIDPDNPRWPGQSRVLSGMLLDQDAQRLEVWAAMLQPVAVHLVGDLESMFTNGRQPAVQEKAAEVLAFLFRDDTDRLCQWALAGQPRQIRKLRNAIQLQPARVLRRADTIDVPAGDPVRLANRVILRALAGDFGELDRQLAANSPDPALRSLLISRSGPAGVEPRHFATLLNDPRATPTACYSAILALGQFDLQQLYLTERQNLLPELTKLFVSHPDAGVHSAARWLLLRWNSPDLVNQSLSEIRTPQPIPGFGWHEDPTGICFAVFELGEPWQAGPPASSDPLPDEDARQVVIPGRFGISTMEVTAEDFLEWENRLADEWRRQEGDNPETWQSLANSLRRYQQDRQVVPSRRPMVNLTWHDAALYCNGLGSLQGLDAGELVYRVNLLKTEWLASPQDDGLQRTGYRLPTGAEWEFACRGGSDTAWFFGSAPELMDEYGWSVNNSLGELMPVGQLQPNRFGIFDGQGNAAEWCHNVFDTTQDEGSQFNYPREVRDQSCAEESRDMNLFRRQERLRERPQLRLGFRMARTYPVADPD